MVSLEIAMISLVVFEQVDSPDTHLAIVATIVETIVATIAVPVRQHGMRAVP
jgi:hypothetical protein